MFSVNNFYNYLNNYSRANKKDLDILPFAVHGSRKLIDIVYPHGDDMEEYPKQYIGVAVMFDQEPINLSYFYDWKNFKPKDFDSLKIYEYCKASDFLNNLSNDEFIFRHFSRVYNPILMHSERNSDEVNYLANHHFHPVHYFYHGLIARDWFRHWKHYSTKRGDNASRLGLYARNASGSRVYRIELIERLFEYKEHVYYKTQPTMPKNDWPMNEIEYDSHSSAHIEIQDCKNFDIQIVPETLFHTTKTHLTEKVFKPIVMKQPFIIAGPPGSLAYLKSYGFRTFDSLWDESYDTETTPHKRMDKIMDVVKYLTSITDQNFNRIMDRAQSIVEHNHKLFFSAEFENDMLTELHMNLNIAIENRNEEFDTMPGGTWFYYQDLCYKREGKVPFHYKWRNSLIVKFMLENNEKTNAELILLKYKHLFTKKFLADPLADIAHRMAKYY